MRRKKNANTNHSEALIKGSDRVNSMQSLSRARGMIGCRWKSSVCCDNAVWHCEQGRPCHHTSRTTTAWESDIVSDKSQGLIRTNGMDHFAETATLSSLLQPLFPVFIQRDISALIASGHRSKDTVVESYSTTFHFLVAEFLFDFVLLLGGPITGGTGIDSTDGIIALCLDDLVIFLFCPAEVAVVEVDLD